MVDKKMNIDWKYTTATLIGIAGIIITVWYAKFTPGAKSIELTIASKSALNDIGESNINDLEIAFEGEYIDNPSLTVLTIENNGLESIRSSDFEKNLKIILDDDVNILKVSKSSSNPGWLEPIIVAAESTVELSPILLNPNDSISINILSDGYPSEIETQSRIAGITTIEVEKEDHSQRSSNLKYWLIAFSIMMGLPAMGLCMLFPNWTSSGITVTKKLWLVSCVVLFFASVAFSMTAAELFGFQSLWKQMGTMYGVFLICTPFALLLNRRSYPDG